MPLLHPGALPARDPVPVPLIPLAPTPGTPTPAARAASPHLLLAISCFSLSWHWQRHCALMYLRKTFLFGGPEARFFWIHQAAGKWASCQFSTQGAAVAGSRGWVWGGGLVLALWLGRGTRAGLPQAVLCQRWAGLGQLPKSVQTGRKKIAGTAQHLADLLLSGH